jgi:hypothetical protein
VPDLGDGINLEHRVYDRDGALTAATVAITVTRPDGTSFTAPDITTPSTGLYRADTFVPDATGIWSFEWAVSGTVTDKAHGTFTITSPVTHVPVGGPYATLAQLKNQMGLPDTNTSRDAELTRRLISASQDINSWCHRQFGRAEVATTRRFPVGASGVDTHDFWTDDDLAIVPYLGTTAGTAWDVSTLALEPADGIVNQVPGWPYHRIAMDGVASHPIWMASNWRGYTVRVTAKWGWENVPENVVTSCIMLAVADEKAKDAPFGVAGFGDFAIRIRANPMVEQKLKDYVLDENLLVAS